MENKHVGFILLGVSVVVGYIVFIFNQTLKDITASSCTMAHEGGVCPMYSSIAQQNYLSLIIVGLLVIVALILIFSKPSKEIIIKKVKEKQTKKKIDTSNLKPEERQVLSLVQENKAVFQADLIEKTNFGKAKMTRIIDRLEGQDLVERKRRGMTNVVVLKEN